MRRILLLLFFFTSHLLSENAHLGDAPVLYKGRIRPFESYAKLLLYDFYHGYKIDLDDLSLFQLDSGSASEWISKLYIFGHEPWDGFPLFWIGGKKVKSLLDLPQERSRYSFNELKEAFTDKKKGLHALKEIALYQLLKNGKLSQEFPVDLRELSPGFQVLRNEGNLIVAAKPSSYPWSVLEKGDLIAPANVFSESSIRQNGEELLTLLSKMRYYESFSGSISLLLSSEASWQQQLKKDKNLLMLPGRYKEGEWFALNSLEAQELDESTKQTQEVSNFTAYSDDSFNSLRFAYQAFKNNPDSASGQLGEALLKAYQEIASSPYFTHAANHLTYPTLAQLKAENLYANTPFIAWAILCYLFAIFCFLAASFALTWPGSLSLFLGFSLHTAALALRCYILGRPPVSNMLETVIYVPWIAVLFSFFLSLRCKSAIPVAASSVLAAILLSILEFTHLNDGLENVQAVLNSHFWLIIHVLMIVGSYGLLILAGIMAHFYLLARLAAKEGNGVHLLSRCMLQAIYLGVALLIPGTILGGVWAAQSWGRFWDWDPKESWAFISSCVYLILIHLYRFNFIEALGLSFGSIIGLGFISFTWYGVNYILGTGLHTYGFGTGSHSYYYIFIAAELAFLAIAAFLLQKQKFYLDKNGLSVYK